MTRRRSVLDATGDLWVERVVSVNGVPWVGYGGVSGISLSEESLVDERNGEVAGSGGSGWNHGNCSVRDSGRDSTKQDNSSSRCPHTLLRRI
ncbi:hypothetical protein Tco_0897901 [Tanacetum coccineum]